MEQKYVLGIVALAVIAILGVSFVAANGFKSGGFGRFGVMNNKLNSTERTAMQQQEQAIQDAIKNNDFTTWSTLMNAKIAQMQAQITQDDFNLIVTDYKNRAFGSFNRGKIPEGNFTGCMKHQGNNTTGNTCPMIRGKGFGRNKANDPNEANEVK